jgi:hypothetical protein
MFTQDDLNQIAERGMEPDLVRRQIEHFIAGFPFIKLARPAVAGDGILSFTGNTLDFYHDFFEQRSGGLKIVKFVPASGAASRMFKHLFEFREKYAMDDKGQDLFFKNQDFNSVHYFFTHLKQIAFYNDLKQNMAETGMNVENLMEKGDYGTIITHILDQQGLNYANLPKALLKFHAYGESARTAAEEHLVESQAYASDGNGTARIHFTISPEHREKIMELFANVLHTYESAYGVTYDISLSVQKPSTDIIAVDEANRPVRNADGSLLFRPGGHGALLGNLNEIDADLIFIKNIDNIVPDHLKETTIRYKKILGGYLLSLKETIDSYLKKLVDYKPVNGDVELNEMISFARNQLFLDISDDFSEQSKSLQAELLFRILNRPIRVCGMVKNEGEPGGGPFWVAGDDGKLSLQIVESSQMDLNDPHQKAIVEKSTHFNPVDLVCSTRNFNGAPFELKEFVDEETGFISRKSSGGRTLKAQELPGLWNGAMANWITVFAEVPVITFNPVKTVNDLLRKEHLPLK